MIKQTILTTLATLLSGEIMAAHKAPYGSWQSPLSAQSIVEKTIQLKELETDGDHLYWLEGRPSEGGRAVFIDAKDQKEMFDAPFYARTTVHEYGGKCGAIYDGVLYFTHFKDQHLYKVSKGKEPELIIDTEGLRFGDLDISQDGEFLYVVVEDHRGKGECKNAIGVIDLITYQLKIIAEGADFYAFPRISPDGKRLAYIAWNHPHMMWDETELFVIDLAHHKTTKIAGGKEISVTEPRWDLSNELVYASDEEGFWKLYDEKGTCLIDQNYDFSSPLWNLGVSRTAFVRTGKEELILTVATDKGSDHFVCKNRKTGKITTYPEHTFTAINELKTLGNKVVFIAATPTSGSTIYEMDPLSGEYQVIKKSKDYDSLEEKYISLPQMIEFPTTGGKTAFGFYYAPNNPDYEPADPEEKPPLIVFTHGGPTAHKPPVCNSSIQYWTTRGFGVIDVNYGGSTGYGREYRNRLRKAWGIVDVDDCCNAAIYLAKTGRVDPERMAIEGGSAGGYTTLAALTFRDVFKAGASYFGVSDLALLLVDTHKYEARYLDSLVGKYPEEKDRYIQYSPLHHIDRLSCPILLLQGAEDKIVLPNQSELMYRALVEKRIPTAYILFEHEQHGFRIAENIVKSLEAELYFYQRIFKIPVTVIPAPIKIENLDI